MKSKFRLTPQRRVILEALRATTSHPTAAELYQTVRKRLPRISLGTVYRNLELMAQEGLIQKLDFGAPPARYDARCDGHYHVRCLRCGRVDDVPFGPLPELESQFRNVVDYKLLAVNVELLGLCPSCRAEQEGSGPGRDGREAEGLKT